MAIHFLSADHRHLGLGTVARLGAVAPHLGPDLLAAPLGLRGALVLSTCNRLALLLDTGDADATEGNGNWGISMCFSWIIMWVKTPNLFPIKGVIFIK